MSIPLTLKLLGSKAWRRKVERHEKAIRKPRASSVGSRISKIKKKFHWSITKCKSKPRPSHSFFLPQVICGKKRLLTFSLLLLSESAQVDKPAPSLGTQSQSSSSGSGSLNTASGPPGSSTSTVPVSPVIQSPATPLLQDPTLLRQLLPALQTALQLNNASVDMAKINEGKRQVQVLWIYSFLIFPSIQSVYIKTELVFIVCSMYWYNHFLRNQILTYLLLSFNPGEPNVFLASSNLQQPKLIPWVLQG